MYVDVRNSNRVVIVRECKDNSAIVRNIVTGNKYLVDKTYLRKV